MANTINDYVEDIKAYCECIDGIENLDLDVYLGVLQALRSAARHVEGVWTEEETVRLAMADRERRRIALVAEKHGWDITSPNLKVFPTT